MFPFWKSQRNYKKDICTVLREDPIFNVISLSPDFPGYLPGSLLSIPL